MCLAWFYAAAVVMIQYAHDLILVVLELKRISYMNIFNVFQVFILNSRCIFCIEIYTEYYLRIVNLCKRMYRANKLLAQILSQDTNTLHGNEQLDLFIIYPNYAKHTIISCTVEKNRFDW